MNNSQSLSPLEQGTNLLINRRTLKLTSAANRLQNLPSYRSKGIIQNAFQNFRSNESNAIKQQCKGDKQNYGMHVQAYKMNLYKNSQNLLFSSSNEPKPVEIHSKSFKIRLNSRKISTKKLKIERGIKIEKKLSSKKEFHSHILKSQIYDPVGIKGIAEEVNFIQKQSNPVIISNWGIFVPAGLIISQSIDFKETLHSIYTKGIEIYIKVNSQEEYIKTSYLNQFCNIVQTNRNTLSQKQVFVNLKQKLCLPQNILFIDVNKDYPLWLPYWSNSTQKAVFLKVRDLTFLKTIIFNDSQECISLESQKEQIFKQPIEDGVHEKISFLKKTKKNKRARRHSEDSIQQKYERNNLEDFQQKMIKYIKILQKQQKPAVFKSPYQIVSDLVRNNKQINKQIQDYVLENQGINHQFQYENKKDFNINYYSLN